jgi:hypothetical protein
MNEPENTIQPPRRRPQRSPATPPAPDASPTTNTTDTTAGKGTPRRTEVPDQVHQRFRSKKGVFFFPDGSPAFTDRGNRLTTRTENTAVLETLVQIAHARGWNTIEVTGSDPFKQGIALAATARGLSVRGHEPTDRKRDSPATKRDRQPKSPTPPIYKESPPTDTVKKAAGKSSKTLITGRLLSFGAAPYHDNPKAAMSYFVRLAIDERDRTIWGVGLERALRESQTRPSIGDEVGLRAIAKEEVRIRAPIRDAHGQITGERPVDTTRNRWVVEKRAFFEERTQAASVIRDTTVEAKRAVQQHPQLVGTYLQLHAAELAAKRFQHPEDRAIFVSKVRDALANAVGRGDPLPTVRLRDRDRQEKRTPPPAPPAPPERDNVLTR